VAHSNESEWQQFKNNKNNEAFLDRICVVKVPYCLRVTEERQIYEKLLRESELARAPLRAGDAGDAQPLHRRDAAARHENSPLYTKMRVYDGENLKDTDPKAKSVQEYRDAAGVDEGMTASARALPSRSCRRPSTTTPRRSPPIPVHLMYMLEQAIRREQFPKETEASYLDFIKSELAARYAEFIGHEIQKAYLESYSEYGQNLFDRYIAYADAWLEDQDFKDPDTGQILNREFSTASCRRSKSRPASPIRRTSATRWSSSPCARGQERRPQSVLDELREAARSHREADVRPGRGSAAGHQLRLEEGQRDREEACRIRQRMVERGYTERQVRRLVEWYMRVNKAGLTMPKRGIAMPNFIDRRLNPKDKSLGNRQRFLKRAREELKRSIKDQIKSDRLSMWTPRMACPCRRAVPASRPSVPPRQR
jgi:serine protein kinase